MRVVIPLLLLASVAFADPSVDQAYQHLRERHEQREAAATQPAKITQKELDALRKELDSLRTQVADLLAENAALRKRIAGMAPKGDASPTQGDISKAIRDGRIIVGMSESQAKQAAYSSLSGIGTGIIRESRVHREDGSELVEWANAFRSLSVVIRDGKVTAFSSQN